jgi:hypothetical protein
MGFTVNASPSSPASFASDLAALRGTGANWIRFGVQSWQLGGWYGDRWYWDDTTRRFLGGCVEQARAEGLKISLTLAAMADVPSWSFTEYLRVNRIYWAGVAEIVAGAGGVDVWQVYNEHDTAHFRDQSAISGPPTTEYLAQLREAISSCRQIVRSTLTGTLVTTAVSGLTVDANTEARWYHFYDVVAPSVDLIGLNCYPGDWVEQIDNLPGRLGRVRNRYGKQVVVTEIGVPTERGGHITVAAAQNVLPLMMGRAAAAAPLAVLVYQLRNCGDDPYSAEENFGVYNQDGTRRDTYDAVVSAIHPY